MASSLAPVQAEFVVRLVYLMERINETQLAYSARLIQICEEYERLCLMTMVASGVQRNQEFRIVGRTCITRVMSVLDTARA